MHPLKIPFGKFYFCWKSPPLFNFLQKVQLDKFTLSYFDYKKTLIFDYFSDHFGNPPSREIISRESKQAETFLGKFSYAKLCSHLLYERGFFLISTPLFKLKFFTVLKSRVERKSQTLAWRAVRWWRSSPFHIRSNFCWF